MRHLLEGTRLFEARCLLEEIRLILEEIHMIFNCTLV